MEHIQMEHIQEVTKPHVDHSTGRMTERKMYMVGDKIFETRESAEKVVLTNWVVDRLNANEDFNNQIAESGIRCIHLRYNAALTKFETNWNAVLQCKYCDPISKKLAKDAIALGF